MKNLKRMKVKLNHLIAGKEITVVVTTKSGRITVNGVSSKLERKTQVSNCKKAAQKALTEKARSILREGN